MRLLPVIFGLLLGISVLSQKAYCQIGWDTLAPLPPAYKKVVQPGVAGAFSGINDQVMIVAGGANFPNGYSWEGGVKRYHDDIYLFDFTKGKNGTWVDTILKLAIPVAYGASVSLKDGIVCIGGRDETKILNSVFRLTYHRPTGKILKEDLPSLPQSLTGLAASSIGNVVYVAGGENEAGATRCFYRIDLDKADAKWETLQTWPGKALINSVLVAQTHGNRYGVYLLGGKFSKPGKPESFTNEVFEYNPLENEWEKRRGIMNAKKEKIPLSAGAGLALGNSSIVLVGGNSALVYKGIAQYNYLINRAKTAELKQYHRKKLDSLFIHHPGFDRTIYVYDVVKNNWSEAGVLPYSSPATINAFRIGNEIILPSGEIRPGVRSSRIIVGTYHQ